MNGTSILEKTERAEVTNISPNGLWILAGGREYFASYKDFPVFEKATVRQIANVVSDFSGNLHWPDLDADIELESLENPENFPLSYK